MPDRPSPAAQTLAGPRGAEARPFLLRPGRSLVPTHEQTALTGGHKSTPTLVCAQHLPALVLHKIFSYLPVNAQGRCALVCRHWNSALPSLRLRLAQWLKEEAPASCTAQPGFGQGFNNRTLPFLRVTNSPLLPIMAELYEEHRQRQLSEPCQVTQQPCQPDTCDLLSGLVHYSLNRQLTLADELKVQETPIDWPNGKTFSFCKQSPCSRWMAFSCPPDAQDSSCLRLYGWEQGHWHKQVLAPDVTEPVRLLEFSPRVEAGALFCIQGLNILAWCRDPDRKSWHRTRIWTTGALCTPLAFYPMADGDLALFSRIRQQKAEIHAAKLRLELILPARDDRTWDKILTADYECSGHAWAMGHGCQLAVSSSYSAADSCGIINMVYVWRKGLGSSRPEQWNYRISQLHGYSGAIQRLHYSPNDHYLLAILSNSQACLWALDAQCRLQERLTLHASRLQPEYGGSPQSSFRSDEKQLAVACSLDQVQLCYSDDNGHWRHGPLLVTRPEPDDPADDSLITIALSPNGLTLVRQRKYRLDIWHQDPVEDWQHVISYKYKRHHAFFPQHCLLAPGGLVCTTVEDPAFVLMIHGPDNQGRFVSKACIAVEAAIDGPGAASADGLSLLLGDQSRPPTILRLAPPADDDAIHKAPQEPEESAQEPAQKQQEPMPERQDETPSHRHQQHQNRCWPFL